MSPEHASSCRHEGRAHTKRTRDYAFRQRTDMRAIRERFPELAELALDLELDELERLAAMLRDLMVADGDAFWRGRAPTTNQRVLVPQVRTRSFAIPSARECSEKDNRERGRLRHCGTSYVTPHRDRARVTSPHLASHASRAATGH